MLPVGGVKAISSGMQARCCGGIMCALALNKSYPADPLVAHWGRHPLGVRRFTLRVSSGGCAELVS